MPNVTLNVTLKDGNLDVDQAGNGNQMGHGQTTTISWHLTTAGGTFNALDASNKGFSWIQTPPDNVFTGLQLLQNGKIQITDNNTDPGGINSAGSWIYQLWATINGTQYSTIATTPTGTVTNPNIKNN
ncbi:MAG: hypothetical protein ACREPQ_07300 [Rhodanobacter sp.]